MSVIQEKTAVVTHITRVALSLVPEAQVLEVLYSQLPTPAAVRAVGKMMADRTERVAEMMELLEKQGFSFERDKQTIFAYSNTVEAYEVKRDLIRAGFADREFQIYLEYTRGWGML
jgi:hypothetical protein